MAYFVLIGSTDPVTPARTFDLVEDEKLAIEMVRVLEDLQLATWSTILPVVARPGMQVRSHSALVEQAQQGLDDRDDETRSQAEQVKREALRRLGRGQDQDSQPVRAEEDDARLDVGLDPTLPPAIDLERHREARPRKQGMLARRRSRREDARRAGERLNLEPDLIELADEAPTPGPAWETVVLDPELPAANAPQSRSSAPGSLYGFGDAQNEGPGHEDDVPPPVDREHPPKRPRGRGFLVGRRSKREQDRVAVEEAVTELVQLADEALPMASEIVPPVPTPARAEARSPEKAKSVEKRQRPPDEHDRERQPPAARVAAETKRQRPPDDHDGERKPPAAKVEAETKRPRRSRGKTDRSPAADVDSVDAPPKRDRLHAPPVEVQDREPAVATASSDDPAETSDAPKPTRKRRSSPAARPRRRAKRQDDQVGVESGLVEAEPSEGASLFSERVAEYTLDHQRQSARERRSGRDRRSGIDRRETQIDGFVGPSDRRAGAERRSGGNRRRISA